jgi:cardiolipin synthase
MKGAGQPWRGLQSLSRNCDNQSVQPGSNSVRGAPKKAALKISQVLSAPNQLTLARMAFLPFIVIKLLDHQFRGALILFAIAGLSDGLDGLLARRLHQQTLLGQYLDPIADKMLLSTAFLVLSVVDKIPWKFTVLVFSRDVCILLVSGVLYTIAGLRDFRPSIFGKANTFAQVAAVVFVMLLQVHPAPWVKFARTTFLKATFALTIISALHYVYLVGHRLHTVESSGTAG